MESVGPSLRSPDLGGYSSKRGLLFGLTLPNGHLHEVVPPFFWDLAMRLGVYASFRPAPVVP